MKLHARLQVLIALAALALPSLAREAAPAQSAPATEQIGPPRPPIADLPEKIQALLAQHYELNQMFGSVLVAENGEIVYEGAFGLANSDWNIPNTPDTKFRLASITKQFTAMVILQLVREGQLELDAPITRYLTDYPAESGDKVTIRHLLNHTSGIPSYTDRPGFMAHESKNHYEVDEFVVEFCSEPLDFEPGMRFSYNNSGYFLLGAIIETVTQKTYAAALQERIFDPVGMHDTGYADQYAVLPGRATGYDDILGGRRIAMWLDMSTPFAAGALYSTVHDLWKWDQALRAKELLDGELEQAMFTPGLENYGFGWDIRTGGPNGPVMSHSGGMPGVSTRITRTPDIGRCIIILGNSYSTDTRTIAYDITDLLEGLIPAPPTRRDNSAIAYTVLAQGIEAGLEYLANLPEVVREQSIERDVNSLAYLVLEMRRPNDALLLFEFLTQAYPNSANTWDSLGEAHKRIGNQALAIKSYEQALKLDPSNKTAKDMLDKLRQEDERR